MYTKPSNEFEDGVVQVGKVKCDIGLGLIRRIAVVKIYQKARIF